MNRFYNKSVRARLGATLVAVTLAMGSVVVGASAAQAGQPAGCSVAANVPFKSGNRIKGEGTGTCSASTQRTWNYEVHRSEGWWHPLVGSLSWTGSRASYWGSVSKCDPGSGAGAKQYFGQSFFSGHTAVLSGNSGELTICD